jgi:hypothetical protein
MAYTPYSPIPIGSINWGAPLNNAIVELDEANNGTTAQDHNMLAWQFDLASNMVATALTSGTVNMSKLWIRQPVTITNVCVSIGTVGAALVAGQNFAGLYNSAGIRVGVTADQTANWGTTGFKEMALTAPFAAAAGDYYVAVLSNAGTTPAFARGSALVSSIANANLTATNGRFTTGPAGQTTLPASVVMAARTLTGNALWAGVS